MRNSDLKVQAIARETGMLYVQNGKEYGKCITINGKELSFDYETQDTEAYICISPKKGRDQFYNVNELDILREEHPEFF